MGYAMCVSACIGCGRIFSYNPIRVPSLRHPRTGSKEPICRDCVTRYNPQRVANGLPEIQPHPDAYEAVDESEMP